MAADVQSQVEGLERVNRGLLSDVNKIGKSSDGDYVAKESVRIRQRLNSADDQLEVCNTQLNIR